MQTTADSEEISVHYSISLETQFLFCLTTIILTSLLDGLPRLISVYIHHPFFLPLNIKCLTITLVSSHICYLALHSVLPFSVPSLSPTPADVRFFLSYLNIARKGNEQFAHRHLNLGNHFCCEHWSTGFSTYTEIPLTVMQEKMLELWSAALLSLGHP